MRRDHRLESVFAKSFGDGGGARAILFRSDANPVQQLPARPVLEHEC